MWLEGRLQFRHKKDTKDRVLGLISQMKREISNGAVLGAKAVTLSTGAEVLFVHAGLRPAMLQLAESTGMVAANATASDIAQWINKVTRDDINECINRGENVPCHNLSGPIYSAGPDRGGSDVGGIYWTDYRVLAALASRPEYARTPVMPWIQVVGHTAEPGSIRSSHGLFAICIDGGMQYGGRTFLEILPSGRFIAHEKVTSVLKVSEAWRSRDLTEEACKFDMSD